MLKKIKNFICNIFNIKACKCDDVEFSTNKFESEKPVYIDPCPRHASFKSKCHMCVAHANCINL